MLVVHCTVRAAAGGRGRFAQQCAESSRPRVNVSIESERFRCWETRLALHQPTPQIYLVGCSRNTAKLEQPKLRSLVGGRDQHSSSAASEGRGIRLRPSSEEAAVAVAAF